MKYEARNEAKFQKKYGASGPASGRPVSVAFGASPAAHDFRTPIRTAGLTASLARTSSLNVLMQARGGRPSKISIPKLKPAPVTTPNRAYLRSLRAAEMAVWNYQAPRAQDGIDESQPSASSEAKTDTNGKDASPSGSWVVWLLAACAALTLANQVNSGPDNTAFLKDRLVTIHWFFDAGQMPNLKSRGSG